MSQTVLFNTRIGNSAFKYKMEIIVHDSKTLQSQNDIHNQYISPLWEIEVQSPVLLQQEFIDALHIDSNFELSPGHRHNLRSGFVGQGIVKEFLAESCLARLLDIALDHPATKPRFAMPREYYEQNGKWFATVLRDQPRFQMVPHLDNSHIMIQMIVNLLQDNETSTDFYLHDQVEPVYRAPTKQNHGVVFVNTPGAIHSISGVKKQRWILYAGILL